MKCREKYTPSTLWVIYSCINISFINNLGVTLTGLPYIHRYLKMETLHYACKKAATYNAYEVHHMLLTLQERNTPNATLYAIAIALLCFGLLCAGEVRMIQVKDVKVIENEKIKRIHVNFAFAQKRRKSGMDYYVPIDFLPIFKRYESEICQASVKQGRVQFLKNWSVKGKRCVQNTGKHTINKLHKVA